MGKKCKILWGEFGKVQVRLWFCLSIICITTHTAFKHVFCTSGCAGSKTTCPCFLRPHLLYIYCRHLHHLYNGGAVTTPITPRNSANQHYSFNCWFCCSVHLHKPIQHTWAQSSQGQPAWLDWGRCEGTSWCFRKRAWRNYWPISTLTPRSNIPTLGGDLWNYCSASEICFWGALSASQCAVKTGEKRDTRRRSLTADVHAPRKKNNAHKHVSIFMSAAKHRSPFFSRSSCLSGALSLSTPASVLCRRITSRIRQ